MIDTLEVESSAMILSSWCLFFCFELSFLLFCQNC